MSVFFSKPANDDAIKKFIEMYPINLDDGYIQFIKKYNGIFVNGDGDYVDIKYNKVENEFISFQSLFGLNASNRNFDLSEINKELRQDIISINNSIVIGEDPGGNFYIFGEIQNNRKIFYWDRTYLHDNMSADKPDIIGCDGEGNYYIISENFEEFWKLLNSYISGMKFIQREHWPNS